MILSIHQPEHMPWLGFFHKLSLTEKFVILDDVQFRKNYFQNRNKIVGDSGDPFWISVPVSKGPYEDKIKDKTISTGSKLYPQKYINLISNTYSRTKFFDSYSNELFDLLNSDHERLSDLNLSLIHFFMNAFSIDTPLILSSQIDYEGSKSDLNLSICKQLGATTYISGPFGKEYLDKESFLNEGIEVLYHEFDPPRYESGNYHPYLSSLDYLFRVGPDLPWT